MIGLVHVNIYFEILITIHVSTYHRNRVIFVLVSNYYPGHRLVEQGIINISYCFGNGENCQYSSCYEKEK